AWAAAELKEELAARVQELATQRVDEALNLPNKEERNEALSALRQDITNEVAGEFEELENFE
ncbi:MAG: hypothetical protein GWN99_04800, partial [Gemmatimonadetes bacterium]|nr:hypothetical protein [Gemmatimonadota bacterium]NIT66045.1 hypothetical protein [Gemmatimonadota bacterium]NIV22621.1 hypothetical protein [Gemmatimonadota bacterium]NIW37702.1 hypothetical protein [Gemmatimonadota bacterium]NIY34623.1 hypothetical protein [Gemmatimonadota bacterium]